ncbi:MAG: hypothetical protein GKR91_10305 [Pseudomonadales bacterium]|nr:hypothetical protein [Pseudomonadales bacterium]
MNKFVCVVLFASLSAPSFAGLDDAQLDLALTEFSFEVFEGDLKTYDSIILDIEQSPRVFKANGALKYSVNDDGFPVTGTCAISQESTIFCAIDASFATLYLELDGELN